MGLYMSGWGWNEVSAFYLKISRLQMFAEKYLYKKWNFGMQTTLQEEFEKIS